MHNFKRHRVNQLPAGARHWKMLNHLKLNRCFLGVDAGFAIEFELFFNHHYGSDDVIHWCLGCCDNDEAAFDNALRLLEIALCSFYDVPLLYRWKHFPLAVSYVKLGMTPHKILLRVMRLVLQDLTAEKLAEYQRMDERDMELDPATKQRVRSSKVKKMLEDDRLPARLTTACAITSPITHVMSEQFEMAERAQHLRLAMRSAIDIQSVLTFFQWTYHHHKGLIH